MIPREHYLFPTGYEQIASESNDRYSIDLKEGVKMGWLKQTPGEDGTRTTVSLVPQGGLFIPITGASFPLKCYSEAGAVFAINIIKAHIMTTLKLIGKWYIAPFLLFINKQDALDSFNRLGMKAISPYLLHDNCLTDFAREAKLFIEVFLVRCGFNVESAKTTALLFVHILDYDNAYRLRVEDIITETSNERLQRPRKEVKRLLGILGDRQTRDDVYDKFKLLAFVLSLALFVPKIRNAFIGALKSVDVDKMKLDTIDTYWVCMRKDYKYMGMTTEQRKDYAISKGWKYPNKIND